MTENTDLVSIGMPVYNSAQHIRQALDGLLTQDYENLELIISDNASTDSTQEICLEYAARDKRVRYYRHERNIGKAGNFNKVFELSSGRYFKWAGSHDYVAPSYIRACKQVLDADSTVLLAYPLAQRINEGGEVVKEIIPEIVDTRGLQTFGRVFVVVAKVQQCAHEFYGLFRASALRRCMPLSTVIGNDMLLIMEISILGAIALVPEVLYYRRDDPPMTEDERIATALMRETPEAKKRRHVRPFSELAIRHLVRAWRLAPRRKRPYLISLIAHTYYLRWQHELRRELRHPLSLQGYKELDY